MDCGSPQSYKYPTGDRFAYERIVPPEYIPSHNNPDKCAQARFLVLQQLVQI